MLPACDFVESRVSDLSASGVEGLDALREDGCLLPHMFTETGKHPLIAVRDRTRPRGTSD